MISFAHDTTDGQAGVGPYSRMEKGSHRLSRARLLRAMALRKLNRMQLAKEVGVAQAQPGKWLKGATTPTGENLDRLCAVLGVTSSYLFGELEPVARVALARQLRESLGDAESRVVLAMGRLPTDERGALAERVEGWVDARTPSPSPAPKADEQLTARRRRDGNGDAKPK